MSSPADGRAQRLLALVVTIPPGRVASRKTLARELATFEQHVVAMLEQLPDDCPWHRVVADGGAIGRHRRREAQIARLVAEGVAVAPAGIVDGFRARRIDTFVAGAGGAPGPPAPAAAPASRARGMKGRPQSSLG